MAARGASPGQQSGAAQPVNRDRSARARISSCPSPSLTPGLFFYLALDRSQANLALARHQLRRIEGDLSV